MRSLAVSPLTAGKKPAATFHEESPRIALMRRVRVILKRVTFITIIVGALLVSALGWWFWHSGKWTTWYDTTMAEFYDWTAGKGLVLKNVYVEGQGHTPSKGVLKALQLHVGEPLFGISLREVKQRLETLEWVREAVVERELPDTLHIRLIERTPIALWQNRGQLFIIDTEGEIIAEDDISPFANLFIMVGEDAPLYADVLFKLLAKEPELMKQVASVIRVGARRWNIRFKNGIEVKLPEENQEAAWEYLGKLYYDKKIFEKDIQTIDLRIPDKLYIHLTPEAAKQLKLKKRK